MFTKCYILLAGKQRKPIFYVHSKNSTEMAREFCGERGVTVKALGIPQQAVSTFV